MKEIDSHTPKLLSPEDAERVIESRVYADGNCIGSAVDMLASAERDATKQERGRVRKEQIAARALCHSCLVKYDCAIVSFVSEAGGINGYTESTIEEKLRVQRDAQNLPSYELRTRPIPDGQMPRAS